jgi:predicted nucleic acid-binding protein
MPGDPVLLDTWALMALINRDDQWHRRAVDVSGELNAQGRLLVITEWILTEFLGGAARPPLRQLAEQALQQFRVSSRVEIVPASHEDWERGFEFYAARADKSWSLVDCLSILLCYQRGITEVFTGDHHFEQAGLRILLRGSA